MSIPNLLDTGGPDLIRDTLEKVCLIQKHLLTAQSR